MPLRRAASRPRCIWPSTAAVETWINREDWRRSCERNEIGCWLSLEIRNLDGHDLASASAKSWLQCCLEGAIDRSCWTSQRRGQHDVVAANDRIARDRRRGIKAWLTGNESAWDGRRCLSRGGLRSTARVAPIRLYRALAKRRRARSRRPRGRRHRQAIDGRATPP